MKVCKKCGNVVNDDIKFCPECGESMRVPATSQSLYTTENNYQSRQYGVPEYEPMPVYNAPEEPQKPKKSKFKKFLSGFAIFMAVVVLATIKVAVSDKKQSQMVAMMILCCPIPLHIHRAKLPTVFIQTNGQISNTQYPRVMHSLRLQR